jgi:hypothetical protein
MDPALQHHCYLHVIARHACRTLEDTLHSKRTVFCCARTHFFFTHAGTRRVAAATVIATIVIVSVVVVRHIYNYYGYFYLILILILIFILIFTLIPNATRGGTTAPPEV